MSEMFCNGNNLEFNEGDRMTYILCWIDEVIDEGLMIIKFYNPYDDVEWSNVVLL